jgi:dihydroorotase
MDKNLIGSKNILIKSGKIIDPFKSEEYFSDIYIKDGLVAGIGKGIEAKREGLTVINAEGCLVCPGFVDMHVHLRDPGDEDEETIESGAAAALKGGITSIACMPNTNPAIDSEHLVKYILEKSKEIDFKVFPVASMTKGIEGKKICEFGILAGSGAVAFSDDGKCVTDSKLMYEIMKYSNQFGLPLILHEEDYNFSNYGLINEGYYSSMLGLDGISSLGEDVIVARDIMLAKKAKAKIHITHVSTKGSVEMIRKAKEDGVNVTCDVTPHHLFFNDSCLKTFNTNFKVKPPIRSEEDRKALVEGIREGVIDAVASDHAPHLDIEKNTAFKEASFGTIGLETLFSAGFTRLCREEKISPPKFISLITSSPAKILGIDAGKIGTGKTADIAVIDTEAAGEVKIDGFVSKSKNSAFIGQRLWGKVAYTISNGKLVYVNI